MDCKSLSESSLNSEYWANTAHFLMCNQAHGHIFFHHLQQELQLPNPDFSQFKPAFDEDLKNSSLKVNFNFYKNKLLLYIFFPKIRIQLLSSSAQNVRGRGCIGTKICI